MTGACWPVRVSFRSPDEDDACDRSDDSKSLSVQLWKLGDSRYAYGVCRVDEESNRQGKIAMEAERVDAGYE
jgi:hypothetical protein